MICVHNCGWRSAQAVVIRKDRMAIDLKKNKDSLQKAYNEVVSDSCETNW